MQRVKALIIEDDRIALAYFRGMIQHIQPNFFEFMEATDLKSGLDIIAGHCDDLQLIVVDLNLPDSQGIGTVIAIKNSCCPSTPLVVLTALDDAKIIEEAKQHGALNYLVKGRYTTELFFKCIIQAWIYGIQERLLKIESLMGASIMPGEVAESPRAVACREAVGRANDLLTAATLFKESLDRLGKIDRQEREELFGCACLKLVGLFEGSHEVRHVPPKRASRKRTPG